MKLIYLVLFFVLSLNAQQQTRTVTASVYDGITSSASVIDNSAATRRNVSHSFTATGTGTWSVQIQYSEDAITWTNFANAGSSLSQASPTPAVGLGLGYHHWIRFSFTGTATANYSGLRYVYLPPQVFSGITNVALTLPSWLTVSGSPITGAGTFVVTPATGQTPHQVIGTCNTATTFAPCLLVAGDIPTLNQNTSGNAATASALDHDPSACATGQVVNDVNAAVALTCRTAPQQFFGTAAPGSVSGNLPGDRFSDTTNHLDYWCNATVGTAAPACTSVTTNGWTLSNSGASGGGRFCTQGYSATITLDYTSCEIIQVTVTAAITSVAFSNTSTSRANLQVIWVMSGGGWAISGFSGTAVGWCTPQATTGITTIQNLTYDGTNLNGNGCTVVSGTVSTLPGFTFANRATNLLNNGDIGYMSDGAPTSSMDSTCVGSSTGALAIKLNGVYRCYQ